MKSRTLTSHLKKGAMVTQGGILFGLGLNFLWHYFLAVWMGWGDTAPDWYFQHQEMIFLALLLLGLISWIALVPRLDGYLIRKKS
jgi:hypothetical protein